MENRKSKFSFLIGIFIICIFSLTFYPLAYGENKTASLSKKITEASAGQDLYAPFEELKDIYFKDNKYAEFVNLINSLKNKNKSIAPFADYYIALARYNQLKLLEEKQDWNEYFSSGDNYRQEIKASLENAIANSKPQAPLNIYARLLYWQFYKDQQDTASDALLNDLYNTTLNYARENSDIKPIKEVADKLFKYQEIGKSRELYKIYADKLITSDITDDALKEIAGTFYKEGNMELAESIYDSYINRITKTLSKEKLAQSLVDIAKLFSYPVSGARGEGIKDPVYAEDVFKKIEEIAGANYFSEELIYMRAFSLEKSKQYSKAKDHYVELTDKFPRTKYADEADYKAGLILTYILRDIEGGRAYFKELAQKTELTPQVIAGIYQLGLLSQWEGDFIKAKEYYGQLIKAAGNNFLDTVALAEERANEIDESRPIEYNLKTFLDVSLKKENAGFDTTKIASNSTPYLTDKDKDVKISSVPYATESGCMQPELQYLWSGHLGTAKPTNEPFEFTTQYPWTGTKEVNLVVVSGTGVLDRSLEIVDIH